MIWKINHVSATFTFASPDGSASSRSFPVSAVLDLIPAQQQRSERTLGPLLEEFIFESEQY
jgi:hypothetical protein